MRTDNEQRRHPVPERPDRPFRATEPVLGTEEIDYTPAAAVPEQSAAPQATREPMETAPKDGRDIAVFWGENDLDGRLVRWKDGRWFNGRRWLPGGRWCPSDGLWPLTMDQPTDWLKPPGHDDPAAEDDDGGPTPALLEGAELLRNLTAKTVAV